MFGLVDADKSGYLGRDEMEVFFKLLGKKQTELRSMYRKVDGVSEAYRRLVNGSAPDPSPLSPGWLH